MDASTRQFVRQRAAGRCEYCRLLESISEVPFHVEHIVARQHDGNDDSDNLALACDQCNFHKGPNLSGIDPRTRRVVRLYHPRRDRWSDHIRLRRSRIEGLTATGRATIRVLQMNHPKRVELRKEVLLADESSGNDS